MGFFHVIRKAAKPPKKKLVNTPKRQDALLKRMGSAVTVDLVKGIKAFKKEIDPQVLRDAWAEGDYFSIMHEIPWERLPEHLQSSFDRLADTAQSGAEYGIETMQPDIRPEMRYDMHNPVIREHVRNAGHSITQNISNDGQALIASQVARWFNESSSPAQVAERIRNSVGLLPSHEKAVENYRRTLQAKGVSPGRIRDQVDAYAERLLTYRCRMIARTETADALVVGRRAVWEGAIAQGLVERGSVTKTWLVDGNPCPTCISLNGKTVGIDEKFKNAKGEYFDDPPTHPHCQCLLNYDSN